MTIGIIYNNFYIRRGEDIMKLFLEKIYRVNEIFSKRYLRFNSISLWILLISVTLPNKFLILKMIIFLGTLINAIYISYKIVSYKLN